MEGYDFLTAHFSNNERTVVEVYWVRDENEDGVPETVVEYIEAAIDQDGRPKEADQSWNNLLKHIDIDTLHDNTAKHIADQQIEFERTVIDIAKKNGLFDDMHLNENSHKTLVNFIFAPFDPEAQKEQLFMIKLELFELPKIKLSKNRAAKTKLRKAENIMTAIQTAIEIVTEE